MNRKSQLDDYLRQNCRRVNLEISRILPAGLIFCLAVIIAKAANLVSYSTGRVIEICLCIGVCSIAPIIICHYSYDEHINRFACLTCIELIFCLIAKNNVVRVDIVYMLLPMISMLYLEKRTFLRALGSGFLIMILVKITDFLWLYRSKRYALATYKDSYESIISLALEYILLAIVLYIIYQLVISLLKTQLLAAYDAGRPVEMVVQENDPIVEEEYNTKGLFLEINQTIQNMIRTKGKTFILDVDSELPIQLAGDKNKIRVLMISLLSDLVQFSNPGERIELEVTYDKGIVPKKGQGISLYCRIICSEDLSRYMDDGIAMNAAMAKSILTRMHGILLDKSFEDENHHTTYTVCLQQRVVDAETLAQAKKKHQVEQKELVAESRKRAQDVLLTKQIKVLIVDDNPMTLKLIDAILKAYGMSPVAVSSSEDALQKLRTQGYDLVMLDHMMPGKGGVQIAKEIRQMGDEYFKTIPMIAMSANVTDESRQMLYNSGFNFVISKPIKEQEIRQAMSDCMLLS